MMSTQPLISPGVSDDGVRRCLPVRSPPSLHKGRERVRGSEEAVQSPLGYLPLLEGVAVTQQQHGVRVRVKAEAEACGIRVESEAEVERRGVRAESEIEIEASERHSLAQKKQQFAGDAERTEQLFLLVVAVVDFA
jgi:hypothetical protein